MEPLWLSSTASECGIRIPQGDSDFFFPVPRSRQDVKTSFSKMRFIFFRTEYWTIFRDFVSWWQYAIILSCLAIARHSCCLTEHHIGHNGSTSGCNALASLKHLGSKQNYFHLIKLQKVVAIDQSTDGLFQPVLKDDLWRKLHVTAESMVRHKCNRASDNGRITLFRHRISLSP